jgi:oligopeptide transport system permease protein
MAHQAETVSADLGVEQFAHRTERGLLSDALRRLAKNRLAVVGIILLLGIFGLAILGNTVDSVQRYSPGQDQDYEHIQEGPSGDHFFGTDNLGRDSWSRVLEGTLISLQVGLGAALVILIIGLTVGGMAALGGRSMDNVMMRFTDITYAFPDLLAIILLRSVFADRDLPLMPHDISQRLLVIFAISFVAWVTLARLVRGQMLSLRERDFVIAARAMGAPEWRIVLRHMLPNTLGPVIVAVVFAIPLAIFAEAVLGFIGFGLPPPTASLGRLINDGYAYLQINVWLVAFPAGVIALLMLCFTFIGDGLRDALDPRAR